MLKLTDQSSVKRHETFLQTKLQKDFTSQYEAEDPALKGVLLLPRAEKKMIAICAVLLVKVL
eukprot:4158772-Ditylum_brightwellii.AAC.1